MDIVRCGIVRIDIYYDIFSLYFLAFVIGFLSDLSSEYLLIHIDIINLY